MPDAASIPDFDTPPEGAVPVGEDDLRRGLEALETTAQSAHPPDPGDAQLIVTFMPHPTHANSHLIEIRVPGDERNVICRFADTWDKTRFKEQWKRYLMEDDQLAGQTSLRDAGWLDTGTRRHLAGLGIKTIEHLAAVTDGNLSAIGLGARKFRDRAKEEIEQKKKASEFDAISKEMAELKAEISAMKKARKA